MTLRYGMRTLLLVVALLWSSATFGQIAVSPTDRVRNKPPGYCAWACLETLGHHQKVARLYGIMDSRAFDPPFYRIRNVPTRDGFIQYQTPLPTHSGSASSIKWKLDRLGVKHKISTQNLAHVLETLKSGRCVMVGMNPNPRFSMHHAVLITYLTDDVCDYIDPNDCQLHRESRKWFDIYWQGTSRQHRLRQHAFDEKVVEHWIFERFHEMVVHPSGG
jgi:hypothetical protein